VIRYYYLEVVTHLFLGRKEELEFLASRYNSKSAQLVVLYGRRRVGKTETLREFCKDKPHVFYSCRECSDEEQLKSFSQRMLKPNINASKYINKFSDWEQAFHSITELPGSGKKLLIIDEFPYLVKNNGTIPSLIQNLWDESLKNENIMIILCGSAMSFIEKKILAEKNPLYGRATGILKMREMSFYDAIRFFPDYSNHDKILAYAVLGGIPHYLRQFDDSKNLSENIKNNILQKGSILYSEVEFLMHQELRETALYNTIIQAIALGSTKLNDIYQKTQIEKSKLSVYLRNLIQIEIIKREFPVSDGIKKQANIQRGLYKIADNFFSFWYAFVFPNISELEAGDFEGVYQYSVMPALEEYASHFFEDVCLEYIRQKNIRAELPFRYSKIGRWWTSADELDIMAVDREKKIFILGECKFKNTPFKLSEFKAMQEKFKINKSDAGKYYYLFSKSGFAEDLAACASENKNIILVPLDELFFF
jgi:AAA+ ATPase superfamily predicted ATPase